MRLREAARPLKPRRGDLVLAAAWLAVLLVAAAVSGLRLATGEGWFAKGLSATLGDSVPLDAVKDRERPFGLTEVAPGLTALSLLALAPLLFGLGLGEGHAGWTKAAWACLPAASPFVVIDALNIGSPSLGDGAQALGIAVGIVGLVCTAAFWIVLVVAGVRVLVGAMRSPSLEQTPGS